MPTKHLYTSVVKDVSSVAKDTFVIQLYEPALAESLRSGQFVEVKVPHCSQVLWRRPFSIHRSDAKRGTFEILFNAVGRGTEVMATLRPGETLDVLGPLGNHFDIDGLKEAVVVAGGLGIAPFMLLMQELRERHIDMTLLYGVGSANQLCCVEEFQSYADVRISTVDGDFGYKGVVTDLLIQYLEDQPEFQDKSLLVCGPTPMLRVVQTIAQQHQIPAQVSVETIMACGFGACVGCAVPMTHPVKGEKEYFLACKDGPVFDMHEIRIYD